MAGRKPYSREKTGRGDRGQGDGDGGFLSRWSERKREASERPRPDPSADSEKAAEASGAEAGAAGESRPAEPQESDFDPKDLPDIETLSRDSDFSVFMHEKVPEALRRRALRRLWRVDPVFAHLDGMNDYDEDYTDAALVVEGLKTVYQVGKGMLVEEPDEADPALGEAGGAEAGGAEAGGAEASPAASADDAATGEPDEPAAGLQDREENLSEAAAAEPDQQGRPTPVPDETPGGDSRERLRGAAVRRRWGDGSG
ncbi:DUF3306 domain-containing protein [Pelagibius sp.]|uniref:DUF3306 domain-containing protein n=1 Tax=Pelagibius sp. TaxID=1931238 RepID=UPI00260AE5DA|nr:DUF3306 domain-containing protein [Pelagibius sp.]